MTSPHTKSYDVHETNSVFSQFSPVPTNATVIRAEIYPLTSAHHDVFTKAEPPSMYASVFSPA